VYRILDMSDQMRALPGQVHAPAQQVTSRAHYGRLYIGLRQHAALEQQRDLLRIQLVVLDLAAVNCLHVQRMTQHERDVFTRAQIGQPVPGEDTFNGNNQIVPIGFDETEKTALIGSNITMH
jgi:hypothetical protein